MNGHVYFVECKEAQAVKIGWARNVKARVDQLRCGCPFDLHVVATLEGDRKLEAAIHLAIGERHVGGGDEWFPSHRALDFLRRCSEKSPFEAIADLRADTNAIARDIQRSVAEAMRHAHLLGLSSKSRLHHLLNAMNEYGPEVANELFRPIGIGIAGRQTTSPPDKVRAA